MSVVIAAYNAGAFIEQAVCSILDQPGLEFEIVIVDDASTDNTAAILAGMNDSRLTVARLPERANVSAVRNRAMPYVRAPWLCVFDADDVMLPNTLAPYAAAITKQPDAAWGYCGLHIVDEQLKPKGMIMRNPFDLLRFLRVNLIPHPMALIKRDLFLKIGGYDESLRANVDYDLWMRMLEYARPLFHNQCCVLYRRHSGAIGMTNKGPAQVFEKMRARLAQQAPDPAVEERRALLRDCLAFLDATDAGDWARAVPIGESLRRREPANALLAQRLTTALSGNGRPDAALELALHWTQKSLRGEPVARHETAWFLREGAALAKQLDRRDVAATLQTLIRAATAAQQNGNRPQ